MLLFNFDERKFHFKLLSKTHIDQSTINLTEKQLLERYVEPFLKFESIAINGLEINSSSILSVRIAFSTEEELLKAQSRIESKFAGDLSQQTLNNLAIDLLPDVTNDFINRPRTYIFKEKLPSKEKEYISSERIVELKQISFEKFDLSKLIRMCEEINSNWHAGNYYSLIALLRTILHHVPPIFGLNNFDQIASNYSGGKSFKAAAQHLLNTSKNIADTHLHSQARNVEVLPNNKQVDFSSDLDFLLSEIIFLMKTNG